MLQRESAGSLDIAVAFTHACFNAPFCTFTQASGENQLLRNFVDDDVGSLVVENLVGLNHYQQSMFDSRWVHIYIYMYFPCFFFDLFHF